MSVVTERCRTCLFFCANDCHFIIPTCDYLLITGHRRGCPAGDDCDKYLPSEECLRLTGRVTGVIRKLPIRTQDLFDLYDQGKNDTEIGKAVGISRQAVAGWRAKNGLPSQTELRRRAMSEP